MLRIVLSLVAASMMLVASTAWADLPGDCDGNGVVDRNDVDIAKEAVGSVEGDDDYVAAADVDGDGTVSVGDLGTILATVSPE